MTVERVSRQMALAGHIVVGAVRRLWRRRLSRQEHRRLVCRAEEVIDETCPQFEDRFLCIRIGGCIPASEDNVDTDIRVELLDITEGSHNPEPVLSASSQWRLPDSPVFRYQACIGVIPDNNAVPAAAVTVVQIPLHLLRFARRGRRRIQASVSVLSRSDGRVLVSAQDRIEYVFCSEGFVELQERHESVLQACVELACVIAAEQSSQTRAAEFVAAWIDDKTRRFSPRSDIAEPLARLGTAKDKLNAETACECLLARGGKADRLEALDIALQTAALFSTLTSGQEARLWAIAETLEISRERFLVLCQKRLLTDNCPYERWRLLLGIRNRLAPEALRQRINGEYRKWNARVTHRDPEIRRQADIILTLIAEVRNRQQKAECSIAAYDS